MTHKLNAEQMSDIMANIKLIKDSVVELTGHIDLSDIAIDAGTQLFVNPLAQAKEVARHIKVAAETIEQRLENILANRG